MNTLHTERLKLQPFQEIDFEMFAKMHGDPKLKANTHARPMNRLQARDLFDAYCAAFQADGFGMYKIVRRDGDIDIGECGLWFRPDVAGYTLRYTILSAHWGQGYSLEAVRAALSDAFHAQGLNSVQAIAMQHNHRSVRVLERVGFVQANDAFRGVHGFLRLVLTAEDWHGATALPPAQGV